MFFLKKIRPLEILVNKNNRKKQRQKEVEVLRTLEGRHALKKKLPQYYDKQ
jgi:hypothetical protein